MTVELVERGDRLIVSAPTEPQPALYRDLLRECAEVLRGEIERGRWFHPGRKTCKICGTQRDLLKRIEGVI